MLCVYHLKEKRKKAKEKKKEITSSHILHLAIYTFVYVDS